MREGRPCGRTSTWWSQGDTLANKVGKRLGRHLHIGSGEREHKKGDGLSATKCLSLGSIVFGRQRCQLIPRLWLFTTRRWVEVFGGVGECSDGMPANIAVSSFGLSIKFFWGKGYRIGQGQVLGPGSFRGRGPPVCCRGLSLRTVERVGSREKLNWKRLRR